MPDQLTTKDVAKLAGITPASVRRYRVRGVLPEPDGMLGATPWWWEHTITTWLETRRKPGRPRVDWSSQRCTGEGCTAAHLPQDAGIGCPQSKSQPSVWKWT